ncbi:hypothetical protein HBI56_021940 [Parastagonospora nodorum]|nr:hypothetical protein HBH43_041660 [Parastagonospora nodorum]KAH4214450.1 hypothetical protein HBI95_008190 [Parastagonospora nodorum]KAH4397780.1 hypothetical protein HBH97_008280 [Parastagonospora nodorum]KAH4975742.1 hypothetical protein HBH73_043240 [Parastagonospora nodorum]KAH5110449.1 hypothetical protein HBH72_029560 [Parastagonospora nodorum]
MPPTELAVLAKRRTTNILHQRKHNILSLRKPAYRCKTNEKISVPQLAPRSLFDTPQTPDFKVQLEADSHVEARQILGSFLLRPDLYLQRHSLLADFYGPYPNFNIMEYQAPATGGGGSRGCYNCGDSSHRAAECPTKGTPTCYNCGEKGHVSRECQNPQAEKTCYRCGGTGHISRECTKEGGAGMGGAGGGQECYKCGQRGHIARNCSQGGGAAYGGGGGGFGGGRGGYGGGQGGGYGGARQTTCYSCGGFGHMSRDCTQGQKCYNCGEVGHLSRDCPQETSTERVCYRCKQPGHVQSACPN